MEGKINCTSSKPIEFSRMKNASKKLGVTINDLVMCATSCAFDGYFKMKGDPNGQGEGKSIQVLMPANMRFGFYPTRDDVKIENKFAVLPLKLPLVSNMSDSYKKISQVTKKLKSSIGYIYTSYFIT
jgi:hypothetical protein